jgi:hypothetical protein
MKCYEYGPWCLHTLKFRFFFFQAMSETNKTKKRQAPDASLDWTETLTRFMKEQLQEFINLHSSSQSSSGLAG